MFDERVETIRGRGSPCVNPPTPEYAGLPMPRACLEAKLA
jgi:hypothetical protein